MGLGALQIGLATLVLALTGTMLFTARVARHAPLADGNLLAKRLDRLAFAAMILGGLAMARLILVGDASDPLALAMSLACVSLSLFVLAVFGLRVAALSRSADVPPGPHVIHAVGGTLLLAGVVVLANWLGLS